MRKHSIFIGLLILGVGCSSPKVTDSSSEVTPADVKEEPIPDHVIPDELIVQLKRGVDPYSLEDQLQRISLKYVEPIAEALNMHLYRFDDEKISHGAVLDKVRSIDSVVEVEFNKILTKRD